MDEKLSASAKQYLKELFDKHATRLIADTSKRHLGGAVSQVLPGDTKDATGRRIIDIGRGTSELKTIINNILTEKTATTASFGAKFVKDRCYAINGNTLQLQMTAPKSTGYERFAIRKTRKLVDIGQSTGLEVQEVTTGIGNAIEWPASTAVTADETICHPTSPDGTYWRCVTSGTTGATEPIWSNGGTITDGSAEWELQKNQPVINNQLMLRSSGTASFGASRNGMRIIKVTVPVLGATWDYGWGEYPESAQISYGDNGLTLLYSQDGKQFKAFRMSMSWDASHHGNVYATVKSVEYDYFQIGSYYYAVPTTITVGRPLVELPDNLLYAMSHLGSSPNDPSCGFKITGYKVQDNGEIWTTLEKSTNAPQSSYASWVYKKYGGTPDVAAIGDIVFFNSASIIYGQDYDNVRFNDFAPISTPDGVGMVVQCEMATHSGDPNTYYSCSRFFLYRWSHPGAKATITELKIEGYETGWHGTADWDNVTASLERVVTDGNNYGVLVKLYLKDTATPAYAKKLFVSEDGQNFKEIIGWSDTVDIPSKAYGIGYHSDYFHHSTYDRVKHLVLAYGDAAGTGFTVRSVTFDEQLYVGTVSGEIGDAGVGEGATIALGYCVPDDSVPYKCNLLTCGRAQAYVAVIDEMFVHGPTAYDSTASLPAGSASDYGIDVPYLNGNEYFILYNPDDCLYRVVISIQWAAGTGFSVSSESFTELHIVDNALYSGSYPLAQLQGEPDLCVIQPSLDGQSFEGLTGSRIFLFRYDENKVVELGRIDGTVFHYFTGRRILSDGYRLVGVDSDIKEKQLDTINAEDLVLVSDPSAVSAFMPTQPSAVNGNFASFSNGDAVDSGIASSDVMKLSVYDTDGNGIVDDAEQLNDGTNIATAAEVRAALDAGGNSFVPDLITADLTIPANHQMGVWEELEIASGVTLTIDGKLIMEA